MDNGWRESSDGLHARFATRTFARGVALIDRIGILADAADHHPDVDLRYPYVEVTLISHDVGRVTDRDVALAEQISAAATDIGIENASGSV